MRFRSILATMACLFALTTVASAQKSVYAGLAGVGMQTATPITDAVSWGLKGEAGFLDGFGLGGLALLRLDVPSSDMPFYVQLGVGARLKVADETKVQPWGSLGVGAEIGGYNLLLQLPGYPVLGLEFPMN